MTWRPLPPEPKRWLVSGVDDRGLTIYAEYPRESKVSALCHIDEIRRHGGRAILGRVMGDEPITLQILGPASPPNKGA